MIQLNKALFPTDFTRCADRAFEYAVHFAGKHGAELHMLHAIVPHDDDPHNPAHHFTDADELHTQPAEIAERKMCGAVDDLGTMDPTIKRVQKRGISGAPFILGSANPSFDATPSGIRQTCRSN